jgi:hypothetical protein
MRPPMNGPQGHPNGPGQQPNPMIRSMTPQSQQYISHPPPQAPSPAQNGQPMTPQQHAQRQQMQAAQAQAQAQAMHHRANQSLVELQAQSSQQMQARQQGQGQGIGSTPQEMAHHQQLQAMQAQQLQNATNQMYASLGLGQVNPGIMASAAAELGWQGRDVGSMSEDERVSPLLLDLKAL